MTAPKSQVWPELDSSLYQVTQHPTSLHLSISTRPTQPLLPFISLAVGFIPACLRARGAMYLTVFLFIHCSLSLALFQTCTYTQQTFLHRLSTSIIVFFLPCSVLAVSLLCSISFFFPSGTPSACLCSFCCTAHRNTKAFVGLPPL